MMGFRIFVSRETLKVAHTKAPLRPAIIAFSMGLIKLVVNSKLHRGQ